MQVQSDFGRVVHGALLSSCTAAIAGLAVLSVANAHAQGVVNVFQNLVDIPQRGQQEQTAVPVPQQRSPAVGLIEDASPGVAVQKFEHVYAGQTILLGQTGTVSISYFSSCVTEIARGGTLYVGTVGGSDERGAISATTRPCAAPTVASTMRTAEVSGVIERVTPFDPTVWAEATVSTLSPRFRAAGLTGPASVRIFMLDAPLPVLVWEGQEPGAPYRYPANAPKLSEGKPYRIELRVAGHLSSAVFSVDPSYHATNGAPVDTATLHH